MGLWDSVASMPQDIASAFLGALSNSLLAFISPQLGAAKVLMTANIDPFAFQNFWQIAVNIISLFYLLLFLVVALKFVFGSYDAGQRQEAKEWFKKALLIVITVNASLLLYSLMLNISSGVSLSLWNNEFENLFKIENVGALDFVYLGVLAVSIFLAVLTLAVRAMYLIMAVMLVPIGLFLNFVPPTKEYGSAILNVTGAAAFMNVLDVIILTAVQMFRVEFSYLSDISTLSLVIGFFLVFIANTALFYIALKKGLNTVGVKISVVDAVKTVAGPAIMSM